MSKFNWNRFYDELEEGDPAKFPYWMFLLNSLGDIFSKIIESFVYAFFGIILMITALAVMADYYEENPDFLVGIFCKSYGHLNEEN